MSVVIAVAAEVGFRDLLEAVKGSGVLTKDRNAILRVRVDVSECVVAVSGADSASSVRIECDAVTEGGGSFLVERRQLETALVSATKGGTKRQLDELLVCLAYAGGEAATLSVDGYEVPVAASGDVDEYPPTCTADQVLVERVVDREAFTSLFYRVAAAAAKDVYLPVFTYVQATVGEGQVELVATDRYRASRGRMPAVGAGEGSALLPAVTGKLLKLLSGRDLSVALADGRVTLRDAKVTVQLDYDTSLDFPRLGYLLDFEPVAILRAELAPIRKAATRALALQKGLGERNDGVRLAVDEAGVSVAPVLSSGTAAAPLIPAELQGGEWESRINPAYLCDALAQLDGETISVEMTAAHKPLRFRDDTDVDYSQVVMPLRK